MNYNPKMGFSEQDYHLLKTHQSSGGSGKLYELVTVSKNTVAQTELVANVEELNDIVVFLNVPALGSSVSAESLVLQFTGTGGLDKQIYDIQASKTTKTTHVITFNNTAGFYEISYSSPADGEIGLNQKGWTAKTFNAAYNDQLGTFIQIPVTKISLTIDSIGDPDNLPVNTIIGVYSR